MVCFNSTINSKETESNTQLTNVTREKQRAEILIVHKQTIIFGYIIEVILWHLKNPI